MRGQRLMCVDWAKQTQHSRQAGAGISIMTAKPGCYMSDVKQGHPGVEQLAQVSSFGIPARAQVTWFQGYHV